MYPEKQQPKILSYILSRILPEFRLFSIQSNTTVFGTAVKIMSYQGVFARKSYKYHFNGAANLLFKFKVTVK